MRIAQMETNQDLSAHRKEIKLNRKVSYSYLVPIYNQEKT